MHVCNLCDATFTRASNLKRHEKSRTRGRASSFIRNVHNNDGTRINGVMDYTSDDQSIDQEIASSVADNDTNCFEMDTYIGETISSETTSDEEEETNKFEVDNDELDNNCLWEKLFILCFGKKHRPLTMLSHYIQMNIESEYDSLFSDIIKDAMTLVLRNVSLHDSIEHSLSKNKELILDALNECDKNNEPFWCRLAEEGGKVNCKWLTGDICYCKDCDGTNILNTVRVLSTLLIAMRTNKLMRQIEEDVLEMNEKLYCSVDRVVKKYQKDIVVRFQDAKKSFMLRTGILNSFFDCYISNT